MITLVMGFFTVNRMMLESERIIRLDGDFILRPAAADEALKKVFMVVTNMIVHPKSISPVMEKC